MTEGPKTKRLSGVTVAVLAGGLGTRLRSVIADRPKVLAEVRGRPFLTYIFDQLIAASIKYAVLCTGYLGEKVCDRFGDSYGSLRLAYSQEPSPRGTAGALRLALPLFKSDSVLVMNGDSYCDADLGFFWNWHRAHAASASIFLVERAEVGQFGCVDVSSTGKVIGFQEKSTTKRAGWVSAGIYLIEHSLIETIPNGRALSLEFETFPAWIGHGLYGCKTQGRFLDIGTPENLGAAEKFFDAARPGASALSLTRATEQDFRG